jgi:predicted ABC-type transport system involved in lysophospholipase L1 biosynthesis ATPase subunit
MALLSLEQVSKRHRSGRREVVVLDGVSLDVDSGDYVGIWGAPRAGKSSLLRLAAGIELPDAGSVRFDGRDLAKLSSRERALLLRRSIGYVSTPLDSARWNAGRSDRVLDHVAEPLLGDRRRPTDARAAARRALDHVGATACIHAATHELSTGERTRVALARALVRAPRLLLIDEPALMPSPNERDAIRVLLRSLLGDSDMTLIVASEDVGALRGVPRLLSVGEGRLLSTDRDGTVLPFRREQAAR